MSRYLVQEIRKCICKKGKQKPRASELSDENLLEVFHRLRRGQTANEIARHAQESWGFMKDRAAHTAGQAIRKLQKRISHLTTQIPQTQTEIPANGGQLSATVIPSAVGYEDIIEIQDRVYFEMRKRTARLMERERTTGLRYKDSAKDLKAISSFGNLLSKMEEFELKNADLLKAQKGRGADEQERLSAQYRLVERSLRLMEEERIRGIFYEDMSKDAMAIFSCGKSLLKIRQFVLTNADLIKAQKREKDEMTVKRGFEKMMAKDGGKAVGAFARKMEKWGDEHSIFLEDAAEKEGMTPEEFSRKRVLSHEEFQTMAREFMVRASGMILNMEDEGLNTLLSALGEIGGCHEEDMDTETLKTQTETLWQPISELSESKEAARNSPDQGGVHDIGDGQISRIGGRERRYV